MCSIYIATKHRLETKKILFGTANFLFSTKFNVITLPLLFNQYIGFTTSNILKNNILQKYTNLR